jgi:outer membrane protein OmpA-like peptidoglycan-associated protein
MKRYSFLLTIAILLVSSVAFSQEKVKIKKSQFYTTDANFNTAWQNLKKGNRLFNQHKKGSFEQAIDYLKIAYDYNPDYAPLNYELGVSNVILCNKKQAQLYMEDAMDLNPSVASDIHFWLGRAYHLNSLFSDAIDEYQLYLNNRPKKSKIKISTIKKYIQECQNGEALSKKKISVIIKNLGPDVNTKYPEFSPVFASYDSIVYFTSRRPNTTGHKRNSKISNEYYSDIYYTSALNGHWQAPAQMPKPVNSKWNDASVAINPRGTGLLIYRGIKGNGDILVSFKKIRNNGTVKWTKPKKVIRKIDKKRYRETTLTFSHDSSTIYFVSNRKGSIGGKDIWMSKRRGNSMSGWSKPVNLGPNINTIYDEESVFLLDNDSVLYFASKGHNSIGGFDVFRSHLLPDGRWTKAENVGIPLNTPADDMFMFVNPDRRTGYYTSAGQDDNYGDMDIYSFFFYKPKPKFQDNNDDLIAYLKAPVNELQLEEPVVIKTMRLTVVKGIVTEYQTNKPLAATIEIVDNSTQKVVQTIQTNASTGEYTVMLPSGKDYGMSVNADGYMFHSENFNIPEATGYQEITKNIELLPVNPGSKVVLRNVFFDSGKATLRESSYPELNRLAQAFKLYPHLVIEISGHTDNVGSAKYNLALSQRRAQAVVDYLVSIGVPRTHLIAKGYGETQPVASNDTEEGRQLNRRVEAKVIAN